MKKKLIISAITLVAFIVGALNTYALVSTDYIVNENNYSIGKGATKRLIDNYYLNQTTNINGDYSGITSGSGNTSTKFVLAKSPRFGFGYFNVDTKNCPLNVGAFISFKSVLGDTYMRITNDNSDGAAWSGNVRFYY